MLNEQQIIQNKDLFISIVKDNVKRDGIDNLLTYLIATDFFIAPCSTKFHLSERGGLCQHSLNVYKCLIDLCVQFGISISENIETITIISLFHDLCKANFYSIELKPVKENNQWVQKKVYVVNDQLPLGHSEKSVMLLLNHMKLTAEEMLAIRWHMGPWDSALKGGDLSLNNAKLKSKFVSLLYHADSLATDILESNC